ncbi:DUF2185 domain-containing protein [Mucilaginibacter aquatilis]|uniref:DUF2185 domain-containing protein n=1 Tax=Mucilaginibacter aquatilis TaxID=1517760 RepID=A0A6I4I7U1_9SPHI|nr:DUF2185 domain-containing protein [Mucilaginibacter aquatilis]MVN91181.1 DUF2185 domain-containing protein [Mucilaginibacter aquatilis]
MSKNFKLKANDIKQLIDPMGGCLATDKITVDGEPVGYMYREEPDNELDSGWRFFAGTETDEYANNVDNVMVYDVNTIVNYDRAIAPYLHLPAGTQLERNADNTFYIIDEEL